MESDGWRNSQMWTCKLRDNSGLHLVFVMRSWYQLLGGFIESMPGAGPTTTLGLVIMSFEVRWTLFVTFILILNCDDLWPFIAVDIVQEPYFSSLTTRSSFCKPIPWPDRSSFSSSHLSSTWYFKRHRSRVRSPFLSFIIFPYCLILLLL